MKPLRLPKELRSIGALLSLDCGDTSCLFAPINAGGLRTNGGCRCDPVSAVARANYWASSLARLEPLLRSDRLSHVTLSFEVRLTHDNDHHGEPVWQATATDPDTTGADWRDYFGATLAEAIKALVDAEERRG